jgi:DNA-binding response OmpR family regulator
MSEQSGAGLGPSPRRILVVEDFAALRILISRVLGAEGHQVVAVATAREAHERSASEEFDLLVTDVNLPGGNGAEIARGVALDHPGLRVLFVSGTAEYELDVAVPGTRTDFLQKPFDIDELVDRVRTLLIDGPEING